MEGVQKYTKAKCKKAAYFEHCTKPKYVALYCGQHALIMPLRP
jgi:hypothetical protein